MILLHFDEIAERSYPAMMALPRFTINNKDNIQGCVLSSQVGSGNLTIFYHTFVRHTSLSVRRLGGLRGGRKVSMETS